MTQVEKRVPLYCDCCASQVVGYREAGRIVWFINTSKGRHTKVVNVGEGLTQKIKSGIGSTTTE